MPELGETADPKALIPGDPALLHETAWSLLVGADALAEAAAGLARISTPAGWSGAAAEEFRSAFPVQPARWASAAECHRTAAAVAVEAHAAELAAAQRQASEAVRWWSEAGALSAGPWPTPSTDPGESARLTAVEQLAAARARVRDSGDRAAASVAAARDRAPDAPTVGAGALDAEIGNAAASFGNAMLNHPVSTMAVAGGSALAAIGAVGLAGGTALSATGVGAVAGIPLGGASAAGVAAGAGLAGAGMIDLALHAAADDRVRPFRIDTDADPVRPPRTPTGERVADVGEPGRQPNVRQLPTDEAVRRFTEEISEGGTPLDRPSYSGTWVTMPDGTEVGFREDSKSGGPTVDVRIPNGETWKVHRK